MFDVQKIQRQLVINGCFVMSDVKLLSLTSILLKEGTGEKTEIPAELWGGLLVFTRTRFQSGLALTKILQGHFFL